MENWANRKTLILSRSDMMGLVTPAEYVACVEQAYRMHGERRFYMEPKGHIVLDKYPGEWEAMPSYIEEPEAAACKWVSIRERNRERFAGCGYPASAYTFGSGGWFGMLPANALAQLGDAHRCMPPSSVFDPRVSMAMAVGFARGLMRWKAYERMPTWLNLRAMWGWPAKGGDLSYLAKAR